jgi:hypothetical protein
MGRDSKDGKNGANGVKLSPQEIFADSRLTMKGVREAMRDMRNIHKRMGVGLVGMKDGKLVTVAPEDIQVDDPPTNDENES